MQAFLNDPQLKTDMLDQIKWHREQDAIIQGTYGEGSNGDWKGCAVGCSIHSLSKLKGEKFDTSDHKLYETLLGIPEWLARLEDTLFEGLPKEDAVQWPERFTQAIPVGVDLDPIKWKFCAYLMKENIDRVLSLDIADDLKEQVVKAIRGVLALHEQAITTGKWDEKAPWSAARAAAWSAESAARAAAWSARAAAWSAPWSARAAAWSAPWSAARAAAESAAWSAARAAAESAAWSAPWSAPWSAARAAAWSAAWSAPWSAARAAAWSAAYQKHADKLIELLSEAV